MSIYVKEGGITFYGETREGRVVLGRQEEDELSGGYKRRMSHSILRRTRHRALHMWNNVIVLMMETQPKRTVMVL